MNPEGRKVAGINQFDQMIDELSPLFGRHPFGLCRAWDGAFFS